VCVQWRVGMGKCDIVTTYITYDLGIGTHLHRVVWGGSKRVYMTIGGNIGSSPRNCSHFGDDPQYPSFKNERSYTFYLGAQEGYPTC
jgi:hypothetical protein